MASWELVKLDNIVTFQEGYVNPSQTNNDYFDGDIKWLRAVDLNDSEVWDTTRKISNLGFESAGKSAVLFKPNTIAISKSGTIGRLGILKDFMCGNRAVINIEVDEEKADLMFVFYSLIMARREIIQYAVGSVQANLYPSVLGKLEIPLPSISIQKKISTILSSLDYSNINYNDMSLKSQEIINSLFRSWFIDFDPVKAKAKGKSPNGMDEETAALFPDSFEDSTLGPIPASWRVGTISELGEIVTGRTPSSKKPDYFNGPVPFITIPDLANNIWQDKTARTISMEGAAALKSAVIPANSVCVSCIATLGNVGITTRPSITNQQIHSILCDKGYSSLFVYSLMKSYVPNLKWFAGGGAVIQNVSKTMFGKQHVIIPPINIVKQFLEITEPLYLNMKAMNSTSSSLAASKNLLLLRLMSGEIILD
jgi:type I restriction enzyme, S subunit